MPAEIARRTADANAILSVSETISAFGLVSAQEELELADRTIRDLGIQARVTRQLAGTLSGGNQQKLVIGKWLLTKPRVLLLDEPTRGIDVGAKAEIYRLIGALAARLERRMAFGVSISEREFYISIGADTLTGVVSRYPIAR